LSHFLSEELLRHPEWILDIGDVEGTCSTLEYKARLAAFLGEPTNATGFDLALFRRKELLRIVIRDGLGISRVAELTEEISNLADAILASAIETVTEEMQARFGVPLTPNARGEMAPAVLTVLALGKLGGRELNYSSDIDLMFLHSGNGETSGPRRITNGGYFKKVANGITTLLSTYTPAGICYRVDLRLRPEGSLGEVCSSLACAKEYYARRARDWELQMLIKARVAAGDEAMGEELLNFVEGSIYSTTLDFSTIEKMSETRERIGEKLARKRLRHDQLDVKLAPGGIRDIEFLVQCLQRLHGARDTSVQHRGTLFALDSLYRKDLLSGSEYARLDEAYRFLRTLEHRLQLEDDRQTHTLPTNERDLERIALRMPHPQPGTGHLSAGTQLLRTLNQHLENVQTIYDRIVHAQRPLYYQPSTPASPPSPQAEGAGQASSIVSERTIEALRRSSPHLAAHVQLHGFRRPENVLQRFSEALSRGPAHVRLLESHPLLPVYTLQILELSPYLSEQLTGAPVLVEDIYRVADQPNARPAFEALAAPLSDIDGLRRFFRRETFRIQAASIGSPESVFQTLDRTSSVAEFLIARGYRIALEKALAHGRKHAAPGTRFEEPQNEMMVVALGRLGMREFDLASDADLLFIIPDSEAPRKKFWTRVAEHVVEILTAYAGHGPTVSIDTRLRPNGREGTLVQSESNYVEYFSHHAEAWEGIAYMKARGVAGDIERSTAFLTQLQQVDWRRYGQSGRSRQDLRQMRMRLQREQGSITPLKAAEGGYYDADFILMYLRLKGAGMFFKSLNTPERIDVVEKMGHLDRSGAELLLEATTYYRAVDHALRLVKGKAEAKLPTTQSELEMTAELVRLWTGKHSTADTLSHELAELQRRVRQLFDEVFQ
ncbi:MAG: (Glutamate--ammonia-ligase) adenylyltransferase, partial [Bryobacterales bacterium]|nr:(Glutamate--ammonia-ligase) adenylyltransferase [Bryobacterales bacterium]